MPSAPNDAHSAMCIEMLDADIDATIALWRAQGLSADAAWAGLGLGWAWAVEWYEVRGAILRWARDHGSRDDDTTEQRKAA